MNAFKCDRCGAYFDGGYSHIYPRYFLEVKKSRDFSSNTIDLCPECYQKLKNWLEDGKEAVK